MSKRPADNSDLVGRQLGDYEILRRLGKGGMAEVYLAEQNSLKRKVAVKVLRSEFASDEGYVRRFQNEARAVASLVHANIVQIYEVGCIDGVHFLAQEYVPGQTLKQLVTRNGPLPIPQAVSILRQVASALSRASQNKMVHRDIKPENILLTSSGEAKVADFGLARVVSDENADMTQIGMTMGTPLYMSPEQVEGRPLDPRSDIYSCGVMAFYMLTGSPPFQGDTPLNIAVQHLQSEPPDLLELREELPPDLCTLVRKMLAKKPDDRFSSANHLLRDLRALSVDGLENHPLEDSLVESSSMDTSAHALDATIELQSIMATQTMLLQKNKRNVNWALPIMTAIALLLGAGLARLTWSGPLLAGSSKLEKQANAPAQWAAAATIHTESAWKTVEEYFPAEAGTTNEYWCRSAKHQLANLYVDQGRLDEAYELYSYLASLNPSEREFVAIGTAGQAIVHHLRGEKEPERRKVALAYPMQQHLRDQKVLEDIERLAEELGIRDQLDRAEDGSRERRPSNG
ncbi:MAG: serine/threonine protein kinase [Planctomycetales bacterium]|nr:serine/threonine protein kinase [Planctomycetales bacterium]